MNLDAIKKLDNQGLFDMICTSVPFGNHYEYSTFYNDYGHNPTDSDFWKQMDYLTPNLFKVLKPGRIAAIHVKDRILYGHQTPHGFMEVAPFSDETQFHFRKHGFLFAGRITIVTDVVRENNSTYRLGWTEMSNDGTKMGVGLPEYVMLFRKPPTSSEDQRADEPVTKVKSLHSVCTACGFQINNVKKLETVGNNEYLCPDCNSYQEFKSVEDFEFGYSRGRWQIDAHSFWRSDGNRPLTAGELYNYEQHVKRMEHLESKGNLPASFMYDSPQSPHEAVWTDIEFMQGLNANQSRKRQEQHLCPLPFDVVNRLIRRYSNEGDIILEPFAGLGTVPYCATKLKRRSYGIELWTPYYEDGLAYNKQADDLASQPTLFDLLGIK